MFLLVLSLRAQQYHPLVDSGAVWSEEGWGLDWLGYTDYGGSKFWLDDDTIIDGTLYNQLKTRGNYSFRYIYNPPYVLPAFGSDDSIRIVGGMREDSSKKVWLRVFSTSDYHWLVTPDVDILLYDFSLRLGDTFHLSSINAIVTLVDSIELLNGEWRSRISFAIDTNITWQTNFWIEGIGSDGGMFGNFIFPFEAYGWLCCFKKSDELLYENIYEPFGVSLSCDSLLTPIGVENLNSYYLRFEISPNPVSDFLNINFSSPNFSSAQIKITDVLGRNLLTEEIESGKPLQIPVTKFSSHQILFCQLWKDGTLLSVKKILIQ